MRRISSPPRGCRPRYFPLSVGRSRQLLLARDYFSFPPPTPLSLFLTFDLFSPHRFIHPRISRLRLSACPFSFPFSFCSLSFSPSKIVAPSRQRSSLYSGASNTRQNKQRKGGTGERGSVIDALFHPHPSTDSYLRIWILWEEKPRGFYRRARREERFSFERFFLSRACTKGNTRHLFRVFFLLLFFLVFS